MKNIIKYLSLFTILCIIGTLCTGCGDDNENPLRNLPVPVITDFTPKQGYPGNEVTITGDNFGNDRTDVIGRVYFNGIEVEEYLTYSDNKIVVKLPEDAETGPITVWVWNNSVEGNENFIRLASAKIYSLLPSTGYPGETITIIGENFFDIDIDKITVNFTGAAGVKVLSVTSEEIVVVIPEDAETGPVSITFDGYQTVTGPEFTKGGEVPRFSEYLTLDNLVTTSGDAGVFDDAGGVGNTLWDSKPGDYAIYKVTINDSDNYYITGTAATNLSGTYVNVTIDSDLETLESGVSDESLQHTDNIDIVNGWGNFDYVLSFGPYRLREPGVYYVKVTLMNDTGANGTAALRSLRFYNRD